MTHFQSIPNEDSPPAHHMEHIEKFATYVYVRMISKGYRIGTRTSRVAGDGYEILGPAEDGVSLSLRDVLRIGSALTELLKYGAHLYAEARDEYEDDATR